VVEKKNTARASGELMRYLSVCSGIEAATVAWHPLGWQPVAYSEIDPFPCAVLTHHYPAVPNWGDMTRFREWPDATVDLLVGGTPCQSFSVAGLRKGLADPRGNLALTYLAILDRYRPAWCVWENVPGVLSADDGGALGSFLGGLGHLGYGFAYRVLDAQYFGLAQRRKRVFVVGHLGDWRRAAAVLFERESLSGHPAPRREAGQDTAGSTGGRAAFGGNDTRGPIDIATAVNAHGGPHGRLDFDSETFIAHSLRADGFDGGEEGTGRGTPLVPIAFDTTQMTSAANRSNPKPGDPCHPLAAGAHPPAVAFDARQSNVIQYGEKTGPLDTDGHTIAVALRGREGGSTAELSELPSALRASQGGGDKAHVLTQMQVRRLTPRECCRLQGFPDDYLDIPYRGKPAADGNKYKALGNSMAVPVMAWIGRRIALVEQTLQQIDEGAA
jgi:DNA (cytosine-5)-methyltransferase 1